jgi:hypothetical protein
MGFHVQLDDDSRRIVDLVKTDPGKILGKPYAAYMLFLITEHDQAELDWLLDNAKALDSLTGNDIAYAVFAQRFNVRLRVNEPATRKPKRLGDAEAANMDTPAGVTRLVNSGKFGMVIDGDELTAITYATDKIASELDITDKLPCMVIIDAVPAEEPCIIKLDDQITGSLIQLLRKSIARFTADEGSKKVKAWARVILGLQDRIAREDVAGEKLRKSIGQKTARIEQLEETKIRGKANLRLDQTLQKSMADRDALQAKLEEFAAKRDERLAAVDDELYKVLGQYKQNSELHFSTIFSQQVRELGLNSKLAAGKATALGYLGSFLKPDTIMKILSYVHP